MMPIGGLSLGQVAPHASMDPRCRECGGTCGGLGRGSVRDVGCRAICLRVHTGDDAWHERQLHAFLSIYNGSASTSNLIMKILDANGQILNNDPAGFYGLVVTWTVNPTQTFEHGWLTSVVGTDHPYAASVRIVSNVPVSATMTHVIALNDVATVFCSPQ